MASNDLDASKRKLLFVSRLRIVDAWATSAVAFGLVASTCPINIALISLVAALAFAFGSDARIRAHANLLLGENPSNSAPMAIRRAITEAARPIGITPQKLFPRQLRDRTRSLGSAFSAGACETRRGTVIFLGDALMERSRDATNPNHSAGDRRFAFDEVRAVLGHELAHVLPGTGASSRKLAVAHRFSTAMTWAAFWILAIDHRPLVAVITGTVAATARLTTIRIQRVTGPMRAVEWATAITATIIAGLPVALLAIYLLWPLARPVSAMAIQRRIEHACDRVAVAANADPSALARFLQKFEPEHLRYRQMPLWQRLNSSHPAIHRRIVDLDHLTFQR